MMNNKSCSDDRILGTIARLQEFYDSAIMHRFYHKCEEFDMDVIDGFHFVESVLMRSLSRTGLVPDFMFVSDKFIEQHYSATRQEASPSE